MDMTTTSNSKNKADRSRGTLSFRARLILATMLITFLAVAGMGFYVFYRAQQTDLYLTQQLDASVRQQAEAVLQKTSTAQVDTLNNFFVSLRKEITNFGATTGKMLSSETELSSGVYWDATKSLSRLPNRSWDNPNQDEVSVFIPAKVDLSTSLVSELNTLVQLNSTAPVILKANPDTVAIYFGGLQGETLYYPNVNLATLVPPDFDVTQRPWFVAATSAQNKDHGAVWSDPYLDAASNGLVITTSVPVYDASGHFRGVDAMDIQLNRMTEIVSNIHIGDTGYAFLLDKDNRLIAMPAAAYTDFGITPDAYPLGSILDQTLLTTKISSELSNAVSKMSGGKNGLETISINGIENFIIYTPIPEVGYSLAIVVPSQQLLTGATAARAQIAQSTQNSMVFGGILVAILLVLSFSAALAIGNRLMKPLGELTFVAEEIAKGNLNAEAKVQGQDEIGLLATTFNSMTSQLRDLIGSLEKRVADRTKDLATVTEVETATATILETDKLLQAVVDISKERFELYHSHIYLLDESGETLVLASGAGEPGRQMKAKGLSIPLNREQSLVARAARERNGVTVNDVTQAPDFLPNPLLPDTRSELAVPMIVGGKVIGVFDVQSKQVGRFTDSDINIQTMLAAQVATSIQNVRSFEQSKSQAELESLVNVIGQKIQLATTVDDTLQTAIRELGLALGASRVSANIAARQDGGNGASKESVK